MKNFKKIFVIGVFFCSFAYSQENSGFMSAEIGLGQALIGDYGLTLSFRAFPYTAITIPISFYSLNHSLLGLALSKAASKESREGKSFSDLITMSHFRAGIGMRISQNSNALDSGLYIEPVLYFGLLTSTSFKEVSDMAGPDFLDKLRNIDRANILKTQSYFAFTPQLNLGYQSVADFGLLANYGIFANYVICEETNSMFSYLENHPLGNEDIKGASKAIRLLSQMEGFHVGWFFNLGWRF